MNFKIFLLIPWMVIYGFFAFAQSPGKLNIIPQPVKVHELKGSLNLRNYPAYLYGPGIEKDPMFDFNGWASKEFGLEMKRVMQPGNAIKFVKVDTFSHPDAYLLTIDDNGVLIQFKDEAGAFYATQTLKQLCPVESSDIGTNSGVPMSVPYCTIYDYPRFSYRGMHLDESRHFFGKDAVKKYIDMLAFQKYNYFHWHLTDDQGWRIEIKRYPKLTEISSCRDETLIGHYSDKPVRYDGNKYCFYYTQEEIKEIVAYAARKYIMIVPEIEMPGHASAALAAYPELGCTEKQIRPATTWGIFDDIFCPKEGTFFFLQNVLDEVMELFPSKYIHIGGDEVPKAQWENCDYCQKLIRNFRLKDEHGLQSYFIQRIEKYVNSKGRTIIGWDEILEGGLAPNAVVMSWRGMEGGFEAAGQDHDVIMTPGAYCYFDYYQARGPEEPVAIGGLVTLKKVYSFEPIPDKLPSSKHKYIMGGQANIWTEYIATPKHLQYMAYPRSFALSEVLWSPKMERNYEEFVQRLTTQLPRLDAWDINYARHFYNIYINSKHIDGVERIVLSCDNPDAKIEMRVSNGKTVTAWQEYSAPVPFPKGNGAVEARVQIKGSKSEMPATVKEYETHSAMGAKVKLVNPAHEKYNAGGSEALVNGFKGPENDYGGDEWLGFSGKDIIAILDMESSRTIDRVEARFFVSQGQWIYPPRDMKVYTIDAMGKEIEVIAKSTITENGKIHKIVLNFEKPIETDKLKIKVNRYGLIPAGAQGAGNEAWLFCDEVFVR